MPTQRCCQRGRRCSVRDDSRSPGDRGRSRNSSLGGARLVRSATPIWERSGADGALLCSVGLQSGALGRLPRQGQHGRDALARAEEHLVGRLAAEGRVREPRVVLGDVELDEGADPGGRVERMEEEPAVPQGAARSARRDATTCKEMPGEQHTGEHTRGSLIRKPRPIQCLRPATPGLSSRRSGVRVPSLPPSPCRLFPLGAARRHGPADG